MDAIDLSCEFSFGQQHFGTCDFGDARLTGRAVKTADLILRHPGGTLPTKLNRNADLIATYRLANNPRVTHAGLLAGHYDLTRRRMVECEGVVLIIHDTTELDFSGLSSVEDLGPIGNGGCRGLLCHNSLAVEFATRRVLGLAHQALHQRRKVPKKESPQAKREHPQRESRLWVHGLAAIAPAEQACQWVHVADRGADTFEFIERCRLAREWEKYLIRSKSNRNIQVRGADGQTIKTKLHDYARSLPTACTREVSVQANKHQTARTATVRLAYAKLSLLCPHYARGEHGSQPLETWVVHVREVSPPPKGCKPLEWILLTNATVENSEQACERVDWYQCRPIVEEFHKAQKTGCGIELPQFTTRPALQVMTALLSVVATQLLNLRDLSRREDARIVPATEAIDAVYVNVLSAWKSKRLQPRMSVHEFCMALAKLGGHLNRKHDRLPGWLILWRGWTKLQLLVEGALAAKVAGCV